MALVAANVAVAITGAVSRGLTTATAPTGTASALTGFTDVGYITEDGVEITLPDAGDATPIKAWQQGTTVRTLRTPSDDLPTWHFTMLETNLQSVLAYFGLTTAQLTQTATEGSFSYTVGLRPHESYVIDVVDGTHLIRDYVPYAVVSEVGSLTNQNGDAIGYEVTISGELSPTAGYNFKRWDTALHT